MTLDLTQFDKSEEEKKGKKRATCEQPGREDQERDVHFQRVQQRLLLGALGTTRILNSVCKSFCY